MLVLHADGRSRGSSSYRHVCLAVSVDWDPVSVAVTGSGGCHCSSSRVTTGRNLGQPGHSGTEVDGFFLPLPAHNSVKGSLCTRDSRSGTAFLFLFVKSPNHDLLSTSLSFLKPSFPGRQLRSVWMGWAGQRRWLCRGRQTLFHTKRIRSSGDSMGRRKGGVRSEVPRATGRRADQQHAPRTGWKGGQAGERRETCSQLPASRRPLEGTVPTTVWEERAVP